MGRCSCSSVVAGAPRRRSIGASATDLVTFEATQYVPQDLQDDYATGKQYADQFSSVASGVRFQNGTLQMSPAAQEAADAAIMGAFTAAAPVLGAALDVLLAVAPKAGPGPGVCATDPPAGPSLSQLQAWPHFFPWSKFYGTYNPGPAGSFEQLANATLEYNWLLGANCYSNKTTPAPIILAALIASWNATHQGPARTISRSGLNPPSWGLGPGYDPIANALEQALPPDPSCKQDTIWGSSTPCGPFNVTSSFQINNGARIVRVLPLVLRPSAASLALTAAENAPKVTKTAVASSPGGGGVLVVAGAAAAGAWWLSTPAGARALSKLARLFRF